MSYKTILVHVGEEACDQSAMRTARAVGERMGATLVGVSAVAWDTAATCMDTGFAVYGGEVIQMLRDDVEAEVKAGEAVFRTACAGYPHPVVWRSCVEDPARVMNLLACGADLIVTARPPKGGDRRRLPSPTDLVMESGLPVLLAAPGHEDAPMDAVLVAWKNTRETRRAVTDALPLLQQAERVHVVRICETDAVGAAKAELDEVVARLGRHGVKADGWASPQAAASVTDDILGVAARRGCGLVVAGAYGHSRMREWAFGGVTSDLLDGAPSPVLFSR